MSAWHPDTGLGHASMLAEHRKHKHPDCKHHDLQQEMKQHRRAYNHTVLHVFTKDGSLRLLHNAGSRDGLRFEWLT